MENEKVETEKVKETKPSPISEAWGIVQGIVGLIRILWPVVLIVLVKIFFIICWFLFLVFCICVVVKLFGLFVGW